MEGEFVFKNQFVCLDVSIHTNAPGNPWICRDLTYDPVIHKILGFCAFSSTK